MRPAACSGRFVLAFLGVAALAASPAGAQPRVRPGPGERPAAQAEGPERAEDAVKARRITGLGEGAKIKTPEYRTTVSRGAKPPKDWVAITLNYDTEPEWIDELLIRYFVLALKDDRGKRSYSLYKCAVRSLDVARGRGHTATVFLRPAAIERFGEVVAVAAEIVYKGQVAGQISEAALTLPEKWWNDPAVTDSELTTARDGYLIERTRSPFAFVDLAEYEYEPY
ncbi:MAG: hypothetical protein FJ225_06735 [Lentisphaerae bacterium]|nr:hypothetical protein [Lentisphaerota bacterium]